MTDNEASCTLKTPFEGVITDVHTTEKTSAAGKPYTRVTLTAADSAGSTLTFNTFGNVVERVVGRHLVVGDKVKLTYEAVQSTWNGQPRVFNNICELLEVKNDNLSCTCATNQI